VKYLERPFAIITAVNPNMQALTDTQNNQENKKLFKKLSKKKYDFFPSQGELSGHSEESYIIYDISFDEALNLGSLFNQESIVFNDGKVISIVKCSDEKSAISFNHSKLYKNIDLHSTSTRTLIMHLKTAFTHTNLIKRIEEDFKIDFYGDHGIEHWARVFKNTQKLANHYEIKSDVFELFALLHDSKRENEHVDDKHGPRAAAFAKKLMNDGLITISKEDEQRLLFACANHTITDTQNPLCNDLIVQICFDSDRLDIGRVGIEPDEKYMATEYAKELVLRDKNHFTPPLYLKRKPRKCPYCDFRPIANVLYGYPADSEELNKEIEEGKVTFGGCCVGGPQANWKCTSCQKEFYKIKKDDFYIRFEVNEYMNECNEFVYINGLTYLNRVFLGSSKRLDINREEINDIFEFCEKLDVFNWKKEYHNPNMLDGTGWELELNFNGKYVKSSGINDYPKGYDALYSKLQVWIEG